MLSSTVARRSAGDSPPAGQQPSRDQPDPHRQQTESDQSSPQKRIPINSAAVTNTAVGQHNFIGDNLSEAGLIGLAHVLELDQGLGDRLIARLVLIAKKNELH